MLSLSHHLLLELFLGRVARLDAKLTCFSHVIAIFRYTLEQTGKSDAYPIAILPPLTVITIMTLYNHHATNLCLNLPCLVIH